MKKYLLLIFLFGLLASPRAAAQEFTEGLFTYRVLNDDQGNPTTNVAIVSSTVEDNADVVIPETTTFDGQEYAVTTLTDIGRNVNTLNLSKNIVEIDEYFFGVVRVTTEILCSEDNPAFSTFEGSLYSKDFSTLVGCPVNIETLTTHENTKKIGDYAAYNHYEVKNIIFNDGLEQIGNFSFSGCEELSDVTFPESLRSIGEDAFRYSKLTQVYVPSKLYSGIDAFRDVPIQCFYVSSENPYYTTFDGSLYSKDLTKLLCFAGGRSTIQFPPEVTSIGFWAFAGSKIKQLVVPETVTSIGVNAFMNCVELTSVELPNTIEFLPNAIFYGCRNLKNINIPDSVKGIGSAAFRYCSSLEAIIVPEHVETVSVDAFFTTTMTAK